MAILSEGVGEALVGAAEATHTISVPAPTQRRSRRWLRVNVLLGKLIVGLLVLLAWKGFQLVVLQMGAYIVEERPILGRLYQLQFLVFYLYLIYCFLIVYVTPRPKPSKQPPPEVGSREVLYECMSDGEPRRCYEDDCAGAWRSIRTRHCRDCGVCQPGFDHHCPFMDACITANTFKPFAVFLFTTIPLIGFAEIPLVPLQWRAVREVVRATWSTEWMNDAWWSRWYSWAGGPMWRYVGALLLGYRHYAPDSGSDTQYLIDSDSRFFSLLTPHLTPLLLCLAGAFVWWVAIAMICTIVLNARRGLSTVQVERIRRWKSLQRELLWSSAPPTYDPRIRAWVPLPRHESAEGGAVVIVDPSEPLFDLGARRNWELLMGDRVWQWFAPWVKSRTSDFLINEDVMRRLQDEARKRGS